jgi:hypothetical protein
MNISTIPTHPTAARAQIALLLFIGILPAEFNWWFNPRLANTPWAFWMVDIFRFVVLPAALIAFGKRRGLFSWNDLGFSERAFGIKNSGVLIATTIVIPAILIDVHPRLVSWSAAFAPIHPTTHPFMFEMMLPNPGPSCFNYAATSGRSSSVMR